MKVLLVSDAGSIHTRRWAASLSEAGVDTVLFSITPADDGFYREKNIKVYVFDLFSYKKKKNNDRKEKNIFAPVISHAEAVRELKRVLEAEKPDILHAHYATSYSLVAALTGFHPLIVSVWGSDVYEFPKLSPINKMAVTYVLGKADRVLSTSRAMAAETLHYCRKDIGITPFGVDTEVFRKYPAVGKESGSVVFGTVKTLSEKYGIDRLIRAFALMRGRMPADGPETVLVIAGKGPDRDKLEKLAAGLGVSSAVEFLGEVRHDDVPRIYSGTDAAVFLSREESFGVSALEAMACEVPVIASDADGFREILEGGAGIIVPGNDVEAAADAMLRLALDPGLRASLGKAGRKRVQECYEWKNNVAAMTEEYRKVSGMAHI